MKHDVTLHEQVILLSIWRLRGNAYGVTLRENILAVAGTDIHYGTLYNTLAKLVAKGLVRTKTGEPTGERGGRRKIYYELTRDGRVSLGEAREFHAAIWEGIPDFAKETPD